jgi:hypothetical protein
VFLDAQNILQSETVLKQQVNQEGLLMPRSWFTNDRRFQLGVRYRFQEGIAIRFGRAAGGAAPRLFFSGG